MIPIDFQGGAHGNFLEFACNIIAGVPTLGDPFNHFGASHSKIYLGEKLFVSNHYSFGMGGEISTPFKGFESNVTSIVSIKITVDDLLPLSQISLLRAGDYNIDNDKLEINTFNKLNNIHYKWVLDELIDKFFKNQIKKSYDSVKDLSWPNVNNLSEFNSLPNWIKSECLEKHNLRLLELNENTPDCPRDILREFFQLGFENPSQHGFMIQQKRMVYPPNIDVYNFNYSNFYHSDRFIDELKKLANWCGITYHNWDKIFKLHGNFLSKQPYKYSKSKCDQLIHQIIKNKIPLPDVNLIEEAYINSQLTSRGMVNYY